MSNSSNNCLDVTSSACVLHNGPAVDEYGITSEAPLSDVLTVILNKLIEIETKVEALVASTPSISLSEVTSSTKLLSPQTSVLVPDTNIAYSVTQSDDGKTKFTYDLSNVTRNTTNTIQRVTVLGKGNNEILFNSNQDVGGIESTKVDTVDVQVQLGTSAGNVLLNKSIPVKKSNPGTFTVPMSALDTTSQTSTNLANQLDISETEILNLKTELQSLKTDVESLKSSASIL